MRILGHKRGGGKVVCRIGGERQRMKNEVYVEDQKTSGWRI